MKAVLFDLDETLFDRTGSLRPFLMDQFSRTSQLHAFDPDHLIALFLALDKRGRVLKQEVYPQLLSELGIKDDVLAAALCSEYETGFWHYARPFPGFRYLLETLIRLGLKIGVITNGQTHIQTRTIQGLSLDKYIDVCLISETEALRKPDPRLFKRAADRLNVAMTDCLFVGDSPDADILGAANSGMKTVWFPNGAVWPDHTNVRPDWEISSLSELAELVTAYLACH